MKKILFLLMVLSVACQPKRVYDDTEFKEISKKNGLIVPYGTYSSQTMIGSFNIPVLYLDSNYARLIYLDSNEREVSMNGTWSKQSFDTQEFSFVYPFNQAIMDSDGIYFLDSTKKHFFEKTADSIVRMPIQDSLNIAP